MWHAMWSAVYDFFPLSGYSILVKTSRSASRDHHMSSGAFHDEEALPKRVEWYNFYDNSPPRRHKNSAALKVKLETGSWRLA
jgi:hypothetical protein